jgi:uncharacterized protein YjbI with pentapeptide repeats
VAEGMTLKMDWWESCACISALFLVCLTQIVYPRAKQEFHMANQEQLDILKQGVDVWNKWRRENEDSQIDLVGANLMGRDLSKADFYLADFRHARLIRANLSEANLRKVDFFGVNLSGVNLSSAKLYQAKLRAAVMGATNFGDTNLNGVLGLKTVMHYEPSFIDTQTLQNFKGHLPEEFLRGCGLSDWEIESAKLYNPDLTNEEIVKIQYRIFDIRATQAIQISPLFISYSHTDTPFVDHLDKALTKKGVRFWRDIHDAKAGRLETQIDRAIRQNPTVLLILSKNSIKSDWVEHEVRHARKLEKELGRDALCPIALDDGWTAKPSPWPERVMEQVMEYNILDFSGWEDKSTFDSKFAKLLSGLDLFYKKPAI